MIMIEKPYDPAQTEKKKIKSSKDEIEVKSYGHLNED